MESDQLHVPAISNRWTVDLEFLFNRCSVFPAIFDDSETLNCRIEMQPATYFRDLLQPFEHTCHVFRFALDRPCSSAIRWSQFCIHFLFTWGFKWQFSFGQSFIPCSCLFLFHVTEHFTWDDIYTNKHTGRLKSDLHQRRELFGSPFSSSLFLICTHKVLSEQTLLLNLSKCVCVFCNRSPTRWLQPQTEERSYGNATTTLWPDFWIYILIMNSFT